MPSVVHYEIAHYVREQGTCSLAVVRASFDGGGVVSQGEDMLACRDTCIV